MKMKLFQYSIERPKTTILCIVMLTLILGSLMVKVKVDTDPENMLAENEAVRVFHNKVKKEFVLHDFVVLGVVNEIHPDGVFNMETLSQVHELTRFSRNLADPAHPGRRVVTQSVIAPGDVDSIEQAGPGQIRFDWMMPSPPKSREEALKIRDSAMGNPLLKGTLVSEDGMAMAIYLPITTKKYAYQLRKQLLKKIQTLEGDEEYYITGLPVAEDTFGVEMFIQMAISAPLAMVAIFLLMLYFFRNVQMVISPMIVAMVSVICTMGLLIGTGNTLHIMSSMIPIFLMPIAVVDSIHILSEFFDRYQKNKNRRKTLKQVMGHLFAPMLYTSLTSAAGFASLALTPIPPVRVFGIFVALGIMAAWLVTIIFIPAYIVLLKPGALDHFGMESAHGNNHGDNSNGEGGITRMLRGMSRFTHVRAKLIITVSLVMLAIAGVGISRIQINDNPVKWFQSDHEIRIADRVLNDHFGGTYEAYLVLEGKMEPLDLSQTVREAKKVIQESINDDSIIEEALLLVEKVGASSKTVEEFHGQLTELWDDKTDQSPDEAYDIWLTGADALEGLWNRSQVFKRPDMLNYIASLQDHLQQSHVVGKSNSITDIVKKVHQELFEGNPDYYRVPDGTNGVAQSLISFQNSHKPDDLWHLVTPDYEKANIWVQLRNGDNKDMESTVKRVSTFMEQNPPPVPVEHRWAGLTYLNVVWQEKMVSGMLKSFLSSFVVVFLMMTILFRSPAWGLLAMVPLSVTIALIYGIIGLIGKDYDMPVAVLSSLTLGLAVDFAIHFLERSRETVKETGTWKSALSVIFQEPARAITRNIIVIAVGFTPLLLAPLVPYQTVGIFLAAIMAVSGVATMFVLPALLTLLENRFFNKTV